MPKKIYRPMHTEPGPFRLNFILLPYGEMYKPAQDLLSAKRNSVLRIYDGGDYLIDSVYHITNWQMCDMLSRMRYGVPWESVYQTWNVNVRAEGYGKDALKRNECIMVVYGKKVE